MLVITVCVTMFMQSFSQTGRHPYMHTYRIYYTKKYTQKFMNFSRFLKCMPQQQIHHQLSTFQTQVHDYAAVLCGLWF